MTEKRIRTIAFRAGMLSILPCLALYFLIAPGNQEVLRRFVFLRWGSFELPLPWWSVLACLPLFVSEIVYFALKTDKAKNVVAAAFFVGVPLAFAPWFSESVGLGTIGILALAGTILFMLFAGACAGISFALGIGVTISVYISILAFWFGGWGGQNPDFSPVGTAACAFMIPLAGVAVVIAVSTLVTWPFPRISIGKIGRRFRNWTRASDTE